MPSLLVLACALSPGLMLSNRCVRSKMPAMNRSRIFRLPAQSAGRGHAAIRLVHALLFAALTLVGIAPAFAQNPPPQNTAGIFIKGRVRDIAGGPVPDATVVLQE